MAEEKSQGRGQRKERRGVVTKNRMDKTLVVEVERKFRHPLYGKVMRAKKKYYVHDEKNEAEVGDIVSITETRPLSKKKRWRLAEIVRHTAAEEAEEPVYDTQGADIESRAREDLTGSDVS